MFTSVWSLAFFYLDVGVSFRIKFVHGGGGCFRRLVNDGLRIETWVFIPFHVSVVADVCPFKINPQAISHPSSKSSLKGKI